MKIPKWFSTSKINPVSTTTSVPCEKEIELLYLTERVVPCFLVDEYIYTLAVSINGHIVKTTLETSKYLTLQEYEDMVKKILTGCTLRQYCNAGYTVKVADLFLNSPVRKRILSDVSRPKKERRYS